LAWLVPPLRPPIRDTSYAQPVVVPGLCLWVVRLREKASVYRRSTRMMVWLILLERMLSYHQIKGFHDKCPKDLMKQVEEISGRLLLSFSW
jgi:hypothetical protein